VGKTKILFVWFIFICVLEYFIDQVRKDELRKVQIHGKCKKCIISLREKFKGIDSLRA